MKDNRKCYAEEIKQVEDIPLFFNPWYLDAVSQEGDWNVALCMDTQQNIRAVLPYFVKSKFGLKHITMPMLTPYLGLWYINRNSNLKNTTKYEYEKKTSLNLIGQIPNSHLIKMFFHPEIQNVLPFIWSSYRAHVRYTYLLRKNTMENLWSDLDSKQRNIIVKAREKIQIYSSNEADIFYSLNELSFERSGKKIPYSYDFFMNLDRALNQRHSRFILLAKDDKENLHAGAYIVCDKSRSYCLAMGSDPQFKNSGAISYLLWESILKSFQKTNTFNFEGGMIPNIEQFFRSFGGTLTPYFYVQKSKSKSLQSLFYLFNKI